MRIGIGAVVCLTLLVGCASPTTGIMGSKVPEGEQAGRQPSADEATQAVLGYLQGVLKDPDSVKQFEVLGPPTRITWYTGLLVSNKIDAGWLVCFRYNAKNSYGGYVGVKQDGVALRTSSYNDKPYVVTSVNWLAASGNCGVR